MNRVAWGLAVVLAVVVMVGGGLLFAWLPRYHDRAIVIHSNAASRDGRWVLVKLAQPADQLRTDSPHAIVDWKTGTTRGWRRIPDGAWPIWNPQGNLLARYEAGGNAAADALVCRRVPDLTEVWRVAPCRGGAVWTPDGEQLVTGVGVRTAKVWELASITRSGARRLIARDCRWMPLAITKEANELVIVCSPKEDKPTQLALLRMDGTLIRRFGPKLEPGSYVIDERLDRFGWRGYKSKECLLAVEKGGVWQRLRLPLPAIPKGTDAFYGMGWYGSNHLWVMQSSAPFSSWSLQWSGKLRKLQWPGSSDDAPEPWIDGQHLLRAVEHRLELIDGHTGQIARQVPVRLPSIRS